ncbi:hypothetical protein [Clostridium cochlearium]|uniref:Uncharacterized protein n=1 Tax=Clostridium cochlearium TaxID=1494 RepID=A0A7Y3V5X3_CLOCO|nr:hypothetical protein [Clostridium cochlearium]NOH15282.1 hypothetical protein [Clostridium cochlearium]
MDADVYIKKVCDFSGLDPFKEKYRFYYDETGNIRKFRLTENGVNAEEGIENDFILGGVLFKEGNDSYNINGLFDVLNVSASEIKFRTLAGRKVNFWEAINKEPIQKYLQWLKNSGLYIHYATLNNIYYSIVDIVDSLIVSQPQFNFGVDWVLSLKSSLYKFVSNHLNEVIPMLYSVSVKVLASLIISEIVLKYPSKAIRKLY